MAHLRLILGDQLSPEISSLSDIAPDDVILMAELKAEAGYANHHQKKIAFIFSAMRHFAEELKTAGHHVDYIRYDDPQNTGDFTSEVKRALTRHHIDSIIVTAPGEYRLKSIFDSWSDAFDQTVEIREDDRFLSTIEQFNDWAEGRKSLRMEFFYRELRRQYQILMDGDQPVGGQWNYDSENRQPPKEGLHPPHRQITPPDAITQEVLALVAEHFDDHFGHLDGFDFATTRAEAELVLDRFITERLPLFGTYQDAMVEGEPWMYHAHIGLYLNAGLLSPMTAIKAAETAYMQGFAPLNAVEGFIRQILGWREYVRGIYWLKMPEYAAENALDAQRPLPEFYWTAETKMNCLKQAVTETRDNAYAHHIQRLMVLGNFALIAGIKPDDVNAWFLGVYADAYEWVELPNVSGMTLFADGGYLASKPYAASGAYINRMSTYCKSCAYKVSQKNGTEACPFNYLYWDFLIRNQDRLSNNPRMGMPYRTLAKMDDAKKDAIKADSQAFFDQI